MNERGKTAIIMVGGAMRSAHGAGFLYALATEFGITRPDILIGSSGNAGNVFYYCAGQWEQGKHIWTELLSTRKFIFLARLWRIMNVDYLIDEVFKRQEPLDTQRLQTSPTQWCIPLSDYDTGKTFYACARDQFDPFEILRAANAIPILFGKRVPLAHRRYIDGEIGPVLQDHLDHALSLGARNIVIINNHLPWTHANSLPGRIYSHLVARGMHDAIIRDVSTDVTSFRAPNAHVIFLSPTNLPCGGATHNKEKIKATFERGMEDARALKDELLSLFAAV